MRPFFRNGDITGLTLFLASEAMVALFLLALGVCRGT